MAFIILKISIVIDLNTKQLPLYYFEASESKHSHQKLHCAVDARWSLQFKTPLIKNSLYFKISHQLCPLFLQHKYP